MWIRSISPFTMPDIITNRRRKKKGGGNRKNSANGWIFREKKKGRKERKEGKYGVGENWNERRERIVKNEVALRACVPRRNYGSWKIARINAMRREREKRNNKEEREIEGEEWLITSSHLFCSRTVAYDFNGSMDGRFVYEGEKHLSILSSFVYKLLGVFKKLHSREITIREKKN